MNEPSMFEMLFALIITTAITIGAYRLKKYIQAKVKESNIKAETQSPEEIKAIKEKQDVSQEALSPKIVLGIFLIMLIILTVVIIIAVNN